MIAPRHLVLALVLALGAGLPGRAARADDDAAGERVHVVARGNTLGSVARRYRVSVGALREANDLARGATLHLGQRLVIPAPGDDGDRGGRNRSEREGGIGARRERASWRDEGRDHGGGRDDGRDRGGGRDDAHGQFSRVPKRPGVVRLVHGAEHVDVKVRERSGRLLPPAVAAFRRVMRHPSGAEHEVDPRLVTLMTMVSDHFGGRPIAVVSGFRPYSPSQFTAHSNHNAGRALDFVVRGVPNEVVRDFCKSFRNAGVGYYPNSSFIHLDVRAKSAFWVDLAGPGERPHYTHPDHGTDADEGAGEVTPDPGAASAPDDDVGADTAPENPSGGS